MYIVRGSRSPNIGICADISFCPPIGGSLVLLLCRKKKKHPTTILCAKKKKKERKIDNGKARSTHHNEYVQEASCEVNIGDANDVANRKLSKTNAKRVASAGGRRVGRDSASGQSFTPTSR
jgi:hypothetical protein